MYIHMYVCITMCVLCRIIYICMYVCTYVPACLPAALENLLKKAQPPNEAAFVLAYQKCKFAVNLAAKLGHHLSHPSASKILKSLFILLEELVGCNKG